MKRVQLESTKINSMNPITTNNNNETSSTMTFQLSDISNANSIMMNILKTEPKSNNDNNNESPSPPTSISSSSSKSSMNSTTTTTTTQNEPFSQSKTTPPSQNKDNIFEIAVKAEKLLQQILSGNKKSPELSIKQEPTIQQLPNQQQNYPIQQQQHPQQQQYTRPTGLINPSYFITNPPPYSHQAVPQCGFYYQQQQQTVINPLHLPPHSYYQPHLYPNQQNYYYHPTQPSNIYQATSHHPLNYTIQQPQF
jgi:hypothetical protein